MSQCFGFAYPAKRLPSYSIHKLENLLQYFSSVLDHSIISSQASDVNERLRMSHCAELL